jgi:poly-gamma-glutamate capsule biosynthesis protein CapA/YwtB (metallophosphatase superfamily)
MKKILLVILIITVILAGGVFAYLKFFSVEPIQEVRSEFEAKEAWVSLDNWVDDKAKQAEENLQKKIEEDKAKPISLVVVGDVMLSRKVGQRMVEYGDYHHPFLKVQDFLSNADLTFGNLESPIIAGGVVKTGSFTFRADPEVTESLAWAGFDVLGLANNHILNKGEDGLISTFDHFNLEFLEGCGAVRDGANLQDAIVIKEIRGNKLAFLCYAYGPDYYGAAPGEAGMILMDEEQLKKDLVFAREKADFVVVSMHDGVEYQHVSSVHQQKFAHLAVDHGADLVIGHHPHVVQEVEMYKDKYIFYSLGNFVFDQMWSVPTQEGLAVKIIIKDNKVEDMEYLPVMIEDYSQPRPANEVESKKILDYLQLENLK